MCGMGMGGVLGESGGDNFESALRHTQEADESSRVMSVG